jgi:hypothetical protein
LAVDFLLAHVVVGAFLLSCYGVGRRVLLSLRLAQPAGLAAALGLCLWCLGLFVLGILRLFSTWVFLVALASALVTVPWRSLRPTRLSLGALPLLVGWWGVPVPPYFTDALVYHLGLPLQNLMRGEIAYLPRFHYSVMPGNAELLYTLAFGLGGEMAAKLLGLALLVITALVARDLARLLGGSEALAVCLSTASPTAVLVAAHLGADQLVALFTLAGFAALWRAQAVPGFLPIAGLLLGAACGSKYTGLFQAGPILVAGLLQQRSFWPRDGRNIASALLCAALSACPWYLRALWLTGNPVYPLAYGLLGGDGWSSESARVMAENVGKGAGLGVFAPVPALLLAAGLAGSVQLWRRGPRVFVAALVVALCAWLAMVPYLRFLLPTLTVLGVAASTVRARWLLPVALATSCYGIAHDEIVYFKTHRVWSGEFDRESYLRARVPTFAAAEVVHSLLPGDANILLVGESRLAFFHRRVEASSVYDRSPLLDVPPRQLRQWLAARYSHVLVAQDKQAHLTWSDPEGDIERALATLKEVAASPQYRLLEAR